MWRFIAKKMFYIAKIITKQSLYPYVLDVMITSLRYDVFLDSTSRNLSDFFFAGLCARDGSHMAFEPFYLCLL